MPVVQRDEWKRRPPNVSNPGILGGAGSLSGPLAITTTEACQTPRAVVRCHRCPSSSHSAADSSSPKAKCGASPNRSAHRAR
jgi:hypothetical protein